jgi:hypothetical protein
MPDLSGRTGVERYVNTPDVPSGVRPLGWVFCGDCYGNVVTENFQTADTNGNVCERCGGTGTLWRIPADAS